MPEQEINKVKFYSVKDPGFEYKIECEDCSLDVTASNVVWLIDIISAHLDDPATDTHILRIDKK